MIGPDRLARVSAEAVVPEQVVSYVRAVAGSRPAIIGACVGYKSEGSMVLVGYPSHDPTDEGAMSDAVEEALRVQGLRRLTVIGPVRPPQAPPGIRAAEDTYFSLPLPLPAPGQKLRNLLRRAGRDLALVHEHRIGDDHSALVQRYLDERSLAAGTRHIFRQLPRYLEASPGSLLVSARLADGRLTAFAVGEFGSLSTAFFLFCFRDSKLAPPGSADLALSGLLDEAQQRGQSRMNLGLGVSDGIRFFKRKWRAEPFLPYVEVTWEPRSHGAFSRPGAMLRSAVMKKKSAEARGKDFPEPGFWETVKEALLGVRRPLDCIQVEVTSRCPGRCRYCPHTTMKKEWLSRDMDMATFSRLWPLMRRSDRVHLQGWGEPLLNPTFFDMAALSRKAGCRVSTTTCGLRMDEKVAREIVESGIDIIAFSLAGTDPESNAARCGIDFDRVCEAVSTLQAVRRERMGVHLEIHFAYLMLASNMEAVRGLPALMNRLGVHAAVISTLDYLPEPSLEPEAFAPHEKEKLEKAASFLGETAEEAQRLGLSFHYELPDPGVAGTNCRENISRSLFISADGSVSPCVYVDVPARVADPNRRVFGNVREEDPVAIWEGEAFRRFRERLACGDPDQPCQRCPKRFQS